MQKFLHSIVSKDFRQSFKEEEYFYFLEWENFLVFIRIRGDLDNQANELLDNCKALLPFTVMEHKWNIMEHKTIFLI